MPISQKLKWRRALSQLKFSYEELEYVKECSRESAGEFQNYYEEFCRKRDIDISQLNNENRSRLDELYGTKKAIPSDHEEDEPPIGCLNDTTIVVHSNSSGQEETEEQQMTADDIAIHEAFSKLFKQIALKIHPDKISKDVPELQRRSFTSMFQDANKSFESKKYYVLLEIAESLGISTPKNYALQTRWMKRENAVVMDNISVEKSTYNFLFSEAETDEEKDLLIRKFMFHLFRVQVQ